MATESYDQLAIFSVVARERSFTRAAAKLGMSQPALSRAMRSLEERLGVRLLARTTRSVSPTEAGAHLLGVIGPRFEEINTELALLSEFRDKPAGTLRITAGEHAAITILQPALGKILPEHPDIHVEVTVDYRLTDIVAEGYDAGVRLGEQVAKDMRLNAALEGLGLAYMPEDLVQTDIKDGCLIRVLSDWCPAFAGYHLYYPSRRQSSPAFALFRDTLRYPG